MAGGSITGAAKALGCSQPAVTRLVQDLEGGLGFALLHRNGPRITPTSAGVEFFAEAELILAGLRTISARARVIGTSPAKDIQISSSPALAASILPLALKKIVPPLIPRRISLHTISSEQVVQTVISGTADIGVASVPLDHPGLDVHFTAEVPFVAVVRDSDELAGRPMVTMEEIARRRVITSSNRYRQGMLIQRVLQQSGLEMEQIIETNATYVTLSLVRAGLGVAIVESMTALSMPLNDLKVVPLSVNIPYIWGVVTSSARPLSETLRMLIENLRDCALERIPKVRISRESRPS